MSVPADARLPPSPSPGAFRDALGRFATGVAFITAAPGGEPAGLIVNSFSSVSLEPPLVSFSPARSSLTWSRMRRAGVFGVNVLGQQYEPFVVRAAPAGADRFAGVDWKKGRSGVPLLTNALVRLECGIVAEHIAGDHWIVVGQVSDLHISPRNHPLIFFAGEFASLQQPTRQSARRQDTAVLSPKPEAQEHDMISPQLHMALAQAKVDDLRRAADAYRLAHGHAQAEQPVAVDRSVTLRFGSPADQGALAQLAELDSSMPPVEPVLLAEVDGQLRAALALITGAVIADPFYPTAGLIDLLRARARQLHANSRIRRSRRLRRWSRLRARPRAGTVRLPIA